MGFDLCGIAPAGDFKELRFLPDWLGRGYAGEMEYLHRSAGQRADVREVMPSAKSVIALASLPDTQEPVLLGAAMLGAVAANAYGSIGDAMAAMSAIGWTSAPTAAAMTDFHGAKRRVHGLMRDLDRAGRDLE